MIIIWKGRGILTPLVLILLLIGAFLLTGFLDENVGGYFNEDNVLVIAIALAFIISGVLTYKISLTHIVQDGVKIRVKAKHSFFFIPMKVWSIIKYVIGGLLLLIAIWAIISG